jgi:hypothetical protein
METEDRGDLSIRIYWEKEAYCILHLKIMDTDMTYHCNKDPHKILEAVEWPKKKKYLQPCLDQRCHFTQFVISVDGLVGNDAIMIIKTLTEKQAQKMINSYSHLCGCIYARLSIVIVNALHMCLQGSIL